MSYRHFLGEWIKRCLEETRQMWGIIKTAQSQGVEESSAYQEWAMSLQRQVSVRNGKRKEMGNVLSKTLSRHLPGVSSSPSLLCATQLTNPWAGREALRMEICVSLGSLRGRWCSRFVCCQFLKQGRVTVLTVSWPVKASLSEKWFLSHHCQAAGWRGAHLSVSTLDSQCLTSAMPALLLHATQQGLCSATTKRNGLVQLKKYDKGSEGWVQSPTSQVTLSKLACPYWYINCL